jgi:hypothetical protein
LGESWIAGPQVPQFDAQPIAPAPSSTRLALPALTEKQKRRMFSVAWQSGMKMAWGKTRLVSKADHQGGNGAQGRPASDPDYRQNYCEMAG